MTSDIQDPNLQFFFNCFTPGIAFNSNDIALTLIVMPEDSVVFLGFLLPRFL